MSGICGIQSSDRSRPVSAADIAAMVRSLAAAAPLEAPTISLPFAALGVQSFPGRMAGVARLRSGGYEFGIALHGNILNAAELGAGGESAAGLLDGLLRLYRNEGLAFARKLRGEFAIAIWDGAQECLRVFTDRFRVHPIFYYLDDDKLVFGSRMKTILACPLPLRLTLNPEAIVNVVGSSFVPTPQTIYREVRKLPPGHCLSYRRGVPTVEPYWDIDFTRPDERSKIQLAAELRRLFSEAVSLRLGQDRGCKRVGTFLSGGVDSSTVTGVLTRLTQAGVPCFSIGFDEQQFNEIQYARIAAKAFAADHHEYIVTPEDVLKAIPVLLDSFDEPFANASAVPAYFCAKLAREHGVDVLYAGDGGDELFAGNERYASQRLFDYYHDIPGPLRNHVIRPVIDALANTTKLPLFIKGQKYIRRAAVPYP
ncbi:MAG TPA: asparagine synthase-related protein, partial [Methylomirabilota bacterium]|nr:asparagine synthase-related protein [Methylomirabilota bacterium]